MLNYYKLLKFSKVKIIIKKYINFSYDLEQHKKQIGSISMINHYSYNSRSYEF